MCIFLIRHLVQVKSRPTRRRKVKKGLMDLSQACVRERSIFLPMLFRNFIAVVQESGKLKRKVLIPHEKWRTLCFKIKNAALL